METLKELKSIIAGKPDNLAAYVDEGGDYLTNDDGEFQIWNSDRSCWEFVEIYALPMRSLSDIERIIELMETLESFKDKVIEGKGATCAHDGGWIARWDHGICTECKCVKAGTNWGVASRKWFKNLEEAKFYKKNGVLPK